MTSMTPAVKWAGGKKQLLAQLESRLPERYDTYYEPFIGGGALLLDIAPKKAVINDVNPQLLNVYKQLKSDVDGVVALLDAYDTGVCTEELYMQRRAAYNDKIASGILDAECAALFIWINKHCFNGLYRVNSKGKFNVPWNKKERGASYDRNNIEAIGRYLSESDVIIREGDFEEAVADVSAGDFVYFDSPYVPVSETASFTAYAKDGFSEADHRRLAALCKALDEKGVKWMLSNNDVPLVREMYAQYSIESLQVRRAINRDADKRKGVEVIIKNY